MEHLFQNRNFGSFSIPYLIFEKVPNLVKLIMSNCVVFRAEDMWALKNSIEYIAHSILFDINPLGETIPFYGIDVVIGIIKNENQEEEYFLVNWSFKKNQGNNIQFEIMTEEERKHYEQFLFIGGES